MIKRLTEHGFLVTLPRKSYLIQKGIHSVRIANIDAKCLSESELKGKHNYKYIEEHKKFLDEIHSIILKQEDI